LSELHLQHAVCDFIQPTCGYAPRSCTVNYCSCATLSCARRSELDPWYCHAGFPFHCQSTIHGLLYYHRPINPSSRPDLPRLPQVVCCVTHETDAHSTHSVTYSAQGPPITQNRTHHQQSAKTIITINIPPNRTAQHSSTVLACHTTTKAIPLRQASFALIVHREFQLELYRRRCVMTVCR
jgi:hypothetical protein